MLNLKKLLEESGLPAERGIYSGRDRPDGYYTFVRMMRNAYIMADDEEKGCRELYRINLFYRGDFEEQLKKTLDLLKKPDIYINSVDEEIYETDTGYWMVPINIEIIREETT